MAEEIIDIRERIEKMRIQIENEATAQNINSKPIEIHHKMSNSNISMSLQNRVDSSRHNYNLDIDSIESNKNLEQDDKKLTNNKESFPSVSLSVKNPVSSTVLVGMIALQILSNIGILYFLYIGME